MSNISRLSALYLVVLLVVIGNLNCAREPKATMTGDFKQIAEAADKLMKSGAPFTISAEQLNGLLTDADKENDPFMIDVCAPGDYANVRIKGAINIPRNAFWKPGNIAKLPSKDKMIVTYCYTGTGSVGPAAVLRLMGYNAVSIEWGFMGWSKDNVVLMSGQMPRFPKPRQNFPLVTESASYKFKGAFPSFSTGKTDLNDILIARAREVEKADKYVSRPATLINKLLSDDNKKNDPLVVDVRSHEEYKKGHIKGSINIPAETIFEAASLSKLPVGQQIIIADPNGQEAVGTSYLLSMLGYNARGLLYGMLGWTKDSMLDNEFNKFKANQKDFPIEVKK